MFTKNIPRQGLETKTATFVPSSLIHRVNLEGHVTFLIRMAEGWKPWGQKRAQQYTVWRLKKPNRFNGTGLRSESDCRAPPCVWSVAECHRVSSAAHPAWTQTLDWWVRTYQTSNISVWIKGFNCGAKNHKCIFSTYVIPPLSTSCRKTFQWIFASRNPLELKMPTPRQQALVEVSTSGRRPTCVRQASLRSGQEVSLR